jgi:hypothetical protein
MWEAVPTVSREKVWERRSHGEKGMGMTFPAIPTQINRWSWGEINISLRVYIFLLT